jgi:hypothetical protein
VKNVARLIVLAVVPFLVLASAPAAQKIETVDGVRVVHNVKGGLWGKTPKAVIELVRKIGDIDTEDEHFAFNYPSDVASDKDGNVYILDAANARIQKFGPGGKYLATIGRKGQGPGEFLMPDAMGFDKDGNLVVDDSSQARIQVIIGGGKDVWSVIVKEERITASAPSPRGFRRPRPHLSFREIASPPRKAGEMRLFRRIGPDGRITGSFGLLTDLGDAMTNAVGNASEFDVDGQGALYVSFSAQNRIEKYSPDGALLWRADRPLNYGTEVKKKGKIEQTGGGITMSSPEMNNCSAGIAVDGKGRSWVLTYDRQLRKGEEVQTSMMSTGGAGAVNNVSVKTTGNTDLRTTDAFKLEIFAADGVLLGEIPLTHFADIMHLGDSLLLIDRERGVTVYQCRIVEK